MSFCPPVVLLTLFLGLNSTLPQTKTAITGDSDLTSTTQKTTASTASDLAKEAYIWEESAITATFTTDGLGTIDRVAEIDVQSEAGVQQLGLLNFSYASDEEHLEISYVRVKKPDGQIVDTPAESIQDQPAPVTQTAPLYSDLRYKQVPVKGLQPGDVLEYKVRAIRIKPMAPGEFWWSYRFFSSGIVKDERLELRVPADKYVQVSSPKIHPEMTVANGERIYTWKTSRQSHEDLDEHLVDMGKGGNTQPPDVMITTFRNWQEVSAWYDGLQKGRSDVTPLIQAKADQLIKGLTTDSEKIEAIYHYVSTQFRYIGIDFGIGRFQPHTAEEVMANQYGDCKDKHTLFAALLAAAGYKAWPVLISSSMQLDPDLPSPGQFDHVITLVAEKSIPARLKPDHIRVTTQTPGFQWADTTPGVAPLGMLIATIRDKEALVITKKPLVELKRTPANPPFPALMQMIVKGKLDDTGTLTAHMQMTLQGDSEVIYRAVFMQTARSDWGKLMQNISYSMGFAGVVSDFDVTNLDDTTQPLQVSYDYLRKDYSDWSNLRIMAPLPSVGLENVAEGKMPKGEIYLGAPGEIRYHAEVELPKGFTIVPSSNTYRALDAVEYHANYKYLQSANELIVDRILKILQDNVPVAAWGDYKRLVTTAAEDYSDTMQMEKSSPVSPNKGGIADSTGTANAQAH